MNLLLTLAILFFALHAILLFTSFGNKKIKETQYNWSHYTLWITGILFSSLLFIYAGQNLSPFIDFFNTTVKKLMPVFIAFGLSIIVHTIVKRWVLPAQTSTNSSKI